MIIFFCEQGDCVLTKSHSYVTEQQLSQSFLIPNSVVFSFTPHHFSCSKKGLLKTVKWLNKTSLSYTYLHNMNISEMGLALFLAS